MFLLLSVTKVPCLLTMKSTSLEGYLRKEYKGPCNSRFAISLHTIGINSVSSKGTAAVVKNLQQDLVDFFLWQLKGRKVSVVILLGSYLPSVEALIEECHAPYLRAHPQIWHCGHFSRALGCCFVVKHSVGLSVSEPRGICCLPQWDFKVSPCDANCNSLQCLKSAVMQFHWDQTSGQTQKR